MDGYFFLRLPRSLLVKVQKKPVVRPRQHGLVQRQTRQPLVDDHHGPIARTPLAPRLLLHGPPPWNSISSISLSASRCSLLP